MDGRGVTTPSQSVKKGDAVTTAIACSSYPLAWQTFLRKEEAMSKAHVLANEHKNLREQIMFHLSLTSV